MACVSQAMVKPDYKSGLSGFGIANTEQLLSFPNSHNQPAVVPTANSQTLYDVKLFIIKRDYLKMPIEG